MKIGVAVLVLLVWTLPAYAAGPTLFKEFSYGQPRVEIQKLPGMTVGIRPFCSTMAS